MYCLNQVFPLGHMIYVFVSALSLTNWVTSKSLHLAEPYAFFFWLWRN